MKLHIEYVTDTILIAMIEAFIRQGFEVSMIDTRYHKYPQYRIEGKVELEPAGKHYKMRIGDRRHYVMDIASMVRNESLLISLNQLSEYNGPSLSS